MMMMMMMMMSVEFRQPDLSYSVMPQHADP